MSEGRVTEVPNLLLRAEGLGVLAASAWAFSGTGASWWWFAGLLLAPDLAMLGYLRGPRVGAAAYNAVHTYLGPLAVLGIGAVAAAPLATALGLVWAAHIGMDRALGYGLKYPWAFKATHLSAAAVTAGGPAIR